MDVAFGGPMTGLDATRLIKEGSPDIQVVVMTAQEGDQTMVEAVEAGASGFLAKAEALETVLATVKGGGPG
jgi:DNA-binding NarL/FixJ family response regulator